VTTVVAGTPTGTAGSTADTTSPTTTTVPAGALPGAEDWELVGYGSEGVVRYRPSTGEVTVTPVPLLDSTGPLSFVATRSAVVVRPYDTVPGYRVVDGRPAEALSGTLGRGGPVLPGPDPDHLWIVTTSNGMDTSLDLVTADGGRAGVTIELPDALSATGGYSASPDGVGYALVTGVGGTYDVRPDRVRLITHGMVLAAGPVSFLVYECDDAGQCSTVAIDRESGQRREVPQLRPAPGFPVIHGTISPDGGFAALLTFGQTGPEVMLLDLRTGGTHTIPASLDGAFANDTSTFMAFTPDGRYLLLAGTSDVTPVETRTGRSLAPLSIPPVGVIAIRPAA
jgi:hypothetical protein